jgi:hypothetical protein
MFNSFQVGSGFNSNGVRNMLLGEKHKDIHETDNAAHDSLITAEDGTVYELDALGQVQWASVPTVRGQYTKQNMWKHGAVKASIYKLEHQDQLDGYNKLLESASAEDPSVVIIETERKFYNGNFVVMVTWCPVMYRILIKKK